MGILDKNMETTIMGYIGFLCSDTRNSSMH